MAVILVIAGIECPECGTITFVTDRRGRHATECRDDSRVDTWVRNPPMKRPNENFVLPVAILSSAEPSTGQVDVAKFTVRYDWQGKTYWREILWPS